MSESPKFIALGWVALGLNLLPSGFAAVLIGIGATGHW